MLAAAISENLSKLLPPFPCGQPQNLTLTPAQPGIISSRGAPPLVMIEEVSSTPFAEGPRNKNTKRKDRNFVRLHN